MVSHSGGEGQNIASGFYAKRPDEIDQTSRSVFDLLARRTESPTALGASVQDAARAGVAQTPQGMALTEARAAAGPRVTPETAGLQIQPELRQVYDRREGMRAALADREYAAAREAPETIGIERTIPVERAGEPIVTYPQARPTFTDRAPRPLDPPPTIEAGASAGPESLARFIARRGGIKLDGEAAATDLHRFNIPGVGNVARADGRSIDNHWRESLIEHGYLKPDLDGGAARDISSERCASSRTSSAASRAIQSGQSDRRRLRGRPLARSRTSTATPWRCPRAGWMRTCAASGSIPARCTRRSGPAPSAP